jgi:hypothetical protein
MKVARYEVPGMRAKQYPSCGVRFESRYSPGQPFDKGILVSRRIQRNAKPNLPLAEHHTVLSATGSVIAFSRHFVPGYRHSVPAGRGTRRQHPTNPARSASPLTSHLSLLTSHLSVLTSLRGQHSPRTILICDQPINPIAAQRSQHSHRLMFTTSESDNRFL